MDASPEIASRVLIAERSEGDRQLLLACLKRLHCSATVTTDSAGALAALRRERFEVLVASADILQESDGIALHCARELLPPGERLPIVVLVAAERDRPTALRLGARACLVKPVRLPELQAALRKEARSVLEEELPHLDERVLAAARKMAGKRGESVVVDLVEAYLEDLPDFMEAVRQAIAATDGEALQQAAHRLRSSSASVGVARLSRTAGLLEHFGQSNHFAGAEELFSRAEVESLAAIEALQGFCEPFLP